MDIYIFLGVPWHPQWSIKLVLEIPSKLLGLHFNDLKFCYAVQPFFDNHFLENGQTIFYTMISHLIWWLYTFQIRATPIIKKSHAPHSPLICIPSKWAAACGFWSYWTGPSHIHSSPKFRQDFLTFESWNLILKARHWNEKCVYVTRCLMDRTLQPAILVQCIVNPCWVLGQLLCIKSEVVFTDLFWLVPAITSQLWVGIRCNWTAVPTSPMRSSGAIHGRPQN